jgi:hypothetical protein
LQQKSHVLSRQPLHQQDVLACLSLQRLPVLALLLLHQTSGARSTLFSCKSLDHRDAARCQTLSVTAWHCALLELWHADAAAAD